MQCRNPFSNQVNSLLTWAKKSAWMKSGRNPFSNQVNSLSELEEKIKSQEDSRNPFSNQVNSLSTDPDRKGTMNSES